MPQCVVHQRALLTTGTLSWSQSLDHYKREARVQAWVTTWQSDTELGVSQDKMISHIFHTAHVWQFKTWKKHGLLLECKHMGLLGNMEPSGRQVAGSSASLLVLTTVAEMKGNLSSSLEKRRNPILSDLKKEKKKSCRAMHQPILWSGGRLHSCGQKSWRNIPWERKLPPEKCLPERLAANERGLGSAMSVGNLRYS